MTLQKRSTYQYPSGFTLVELLVTITIIAVLATLSAMGFSMMKKGAAAAKDTNTLRQIFSCISMYASDQNDLLPGPLFTRQTPVYNKPAPSNPREWRRLSDCFAPYLGYDSPQRGELINPLTASWQKNSTSLNAPAWYMQQRLPIGLGSVFQVPWGKPAPASNEERMPMRLQVVLSQPKTERTWAITEFDQLHPEVKDQALKEGTPEGLAHGTYRLGGYFDGSVGKFNKDNKPL